ncbi:hypothetical protein FRC00_001063, partial [Tulasnella sp. 408]
MAYLYQLFTKDVRDEVEPLKFYLHARLGDRGKARARRIIERHGGVVVATQPAAEIIVADPCHPTFWRLLEMYARAGDQKTVESIGSIKKWIEDEHVDYARDKRRRRGGIRPGTKVKPFTMTDLKNEAGYARWVYATSDNPERELASNAVWEARREMGGRFAWMRTHPASAWSRRHRYRKIRLHFKRAIARLQNAADADNEEEEVLRIVNQPQGEDQVVGVRASAPGDASEIRNNATGVEQPVRPSPPPAPSQGPASCAGSAVHRTPSAPQRQQNLQPSPDPLPSVRSQPGNSNQHPTGITDSVTPFIQQVIALRTPAPNTTVRAAQETASLPLVGQLFAGSSSAGHSRPRDTIVASASKTLVEPLTGGTVRSIATQTANRSAFPSSLPGTTISRPNQVANGRPQESPSRRKGPAENLAEGEDADMEPLDDPRRLLT